MDLDLIYFSSNKDVNYQCSNVVYTRVVGSANLMLCWRSALDSGKDKSDVDV